MKLSKIFLVMAALICFIIVSVTFTNCKTTKLDERTESDMSGDADDFNDAIEKNMKELFEKGQAVFSF